MMSNVLLLATLGVVIITCTGNTIYIGVIVDNDNGSVNAELLHSNISANDECPLDHTIETSIQLVLSPEPKSELDIKQFVKKMSDLAVLAVISTDVCSEILTRSLHYSNIPMVRINSSDDCDIQSQELSNILTYPSQLSKREFVYYILRGIHMEQVNIFVEQEYMSLNLYTNLIGYLVENEIQHEVYIINNNVSESVLQHIIWKSQQKKSVFMNNMVFVSLSTTKRIISQATETEKNMTEAKNMFYASRWLIWTEDSFSVSDELTPILQTFDNFAVIQVSSQNVPGIETRLKDTLNLIRDGIEQSMQDVMCTMPPFVISNNTKISPSHASMFKNIKKIITQQDVYGICSVYAIFIVHSRPGIIKFVPNSICTANNRLQEAKLFPNENYGLQGKHLIVASITSSPFVIRNETNGTIAWNGMCMDMLRELSIMLNFTYDIILPPDGQYGVPYVNGDWYGKWNGMVGMLQNKEVDLIVAALSATVERDHVIDFVEYFSEYGSVLLKKPDENEDKWRVIAQPFHWAVWIGIILSIPASGIAAWAVSRLVVNLSYIPRDKFYNLQDATWYVFGALFTQGGYFEPRTNPGRAFVGCWWAFCIVIVASYGGSLIAYLTVSKSTMPFTALDEMVSQSRYKWGTTGGSVYVTKLSLYANSSGSVLHEVWTGIEKFAASDESILSTSKDVLFDKVEDGDFGLISDRTVVQMRAAADKTCQLAVIDDLFLPLPLGIGMDENSRYKQLFGESVRRLRQSGLLEFWQQKWWPKQECSGIPVPESTAVSLLDTQSSFYFLLVGIVFAVFALSLEICNVNRRNRDTSHSQSNGFDKSSLDNNRIVMKRILATETRPISLHRIS